MLTNAKLRESKQNRRASAKKAENCEAYLGPGYYDVSREFDRGQSAGKGNPMVGKVV